MAEALPYGCWFAFDRSDWRPGLPGLVFLPLGLEPLACFLLAFLFDPFYFSMALRESLTSYYILGFLLRLAAFDCFDWALAMPSPCSDGSEPLLISLGF